MILYSATENGSSITEVESERQSEKSIWINGTRNNWTSYWSSYFLTKEEAKKYLMDNCLNRIQYLEGQIKQQKDRLSKINLL